MDLGSEDIGELLDRLLTLLTLDLPSLIILDSSFDNSPRRSKFSSLRKAAASFSPSLSNSSSLIFSSEMEIFSALSHAFSKALLRNSAPISSPSLRASALQLNSIHAEHPADGLYQDIIFLRKDGAGIEN